MVKHIFVTKDGKGMTREQLLEQSRIVKSPNNKNGRPFGEDWEAIFETASQEIKAQKRLQ